MNYKSRLILLFILIAIIPIIALSAVSAYTVLKFKDQLSNMYFGINLNQANLQESNHDLQSTRINLLQYINAENVNEQKAAILELEKNSNGFVQSFGGYEEISNFPTHTGFVVNNDIDQLIADEQGLVSEINIEWNQYYDKIKDLVILSKDPNFRQAGINNAVQALAMLDKLEFSHQNLIALNVDFARTLYEASTTMVQQAYFFVGIAASISAACATGAAILVSKRVILGDLVSKTKIEMVETTLRDLLGEGADLILEVVRKELPGKGVKENIQKV